MRRQQAQQLHAGITRAADDADFDHAGITRLERDGILTDAHNLRLTETCPGCGNPRDKKRGLRAPFVRRDSLLLRSS